MCAAYGVDAASLLDEVERIDVAIERLQGVRAELNDGLADLTAEWPSLRARLTDAFEGEGVSDDGS